MMPTFTPAQVREFVASFEKELFAAQRFKIDLGTDWCNGIDKKAGIYLIFDNDDVVYIGEPQTFLAE